MTAKDFLESYGIDLNQTALFSVIDGYVRQPNLCNLLEKFLEINQKEKLNTEHQDRRIPFNANL